MPRAAFTQSVRLRITIAVRGLCRGDGAHDRADKTAGFLVISANGGADSML